MCRGGLCLCCLSVVSVAHAKVGKRFRNHKSVARFFLPPSLPFPFPFLLPPSLPPPSLSPFLPFSLSFSLPLSLPLSMSWKREYGYTPPIVKPGGGSQPIYIL